MKRKYEIAYREELDGADYSDRFGPGEQTVEMFMSRRRENASRKEAPHGSV